MNNEETSDSKTVLGRMSQRVRAALANRRVLLALKIAVSGAVLGYLFYFIDVGQFYDRLAGLPAWFVFFAWAYYAGCTLISACRWRLLLASRGIPLPVLRLFNFYMVGMFLNSFMPGAVGGDVIKSWDLYRLTGRGNDAVASVFVDRFTGLIGLTLLGALAAPFGQHLLDSRVAVIAIFGSLVFLSAVVAVLWIGPIARLAIRIIRGVLPGRIAEKLADLYMALHLYQERPRALAAAIVLSMIIQCLQASYYAMTALALGIHVEVFYFILFLPAVVLISTVPLTFGGLGVREGVMIVLFAQVGVAGSDVLAISLTVFVINTLLSLYGGLLLIRRRAPAPNVESGS